jgi:Mn-containing catalase
MFLRIDKLQIELPKPQEADPNAAAAVQELLGGRFGEMSTLMNYMYQSFNFRGREKLKPYYDLISNIATEELGHIELVAASINLLLNGPHDADPGEQADPAGAPLGFGKDARNAHHFIVTGQASQVGDAMGQPWRGDYVFSSGNLILDLVHNFFLECGARTYKLRVYEMTDNPAAREMLGYLFVRGGVHATAYAKALETLTGVEMTKLLPIPRIENAAVPESRKFEDQGFHRKLYRFSPEDYRDIAKIWTGPSPDGSGDLEVVDGPPDGGKLADLSSISESFAPEYHPEEIFEIARKLYDKAK